MKRTAGSRCFKGRRLATSVAAAAPAASAIAAKAHATLELSSLQIHTQSK
jgi:hypothetical protein